jgi:LysR family transcriptional regulator, carnitine catabolism transcriptional activator
MVDRPLDTRQLEYFLAVIEHGGMSRGARALYVAQPSVSQAIRSLERDVGSPLFHRVGHRLVPSAAGEALIGPARRALRDLAIARASVRAVVDLEVGSLDIATIATLAVDPVVNLAGAFQRRYPGVTIRMHERHAAAVGFCVRDGTCELGLTSLPVTLEDIVSHALADQELVLVATPELLGGDSDRPIPLSELDAIPMIASPLGTSTRELLEAALGSVGAAPRIAVQTESREAIVPLVLQGAGATLLPRQLAEVAAQRGATLRAVDPPITRNVVVVRRDGPLSPASRAFLALAGVDLAENA